MNRIYSKVWNQSTGQVAVASELAKAKGKHIGRPAGMDSEKYNKVKKLLDRGLSIPEIVEVTGVSLASVKRYRKAMNV